MSIWQHSFETLTGRNSYILDQELFTDCSFIVGHNEDTRTFKCLRASLAKTSPVFEAMLFGDLSENERFDIKVPDIQPAAFTTVLQYIYCGKVVLEDVNVACGVLYAAKKYLLPPGFLLQCRAFIWANMYPNDVWTVLNFAEQNDEHILHDIAWRLIQEDTTYMLRKEEFVNLSEATLLHLLQQDHLYCPEVDLYRATVRWARHQVSLLAGENIPTVREIAEPLIPLIRFLSMTSCDLSQCLKYDKLLTSDESTNIFVGISTDDLSTLPPTISKNTNPRERPLYRGDSFDVLACDPDVLPIKVSPGKLDTFSVFSNAYIFVKDNLDCLGVVIPSQIKPNNCKSSIYKEDLTVVLCGSGFKNIYASVRYTRCVKYDSSFRVYFSNEGGILVKNYEKLLIVKVFFHTSGNYPLSCVSDKEKDVGYGNFGCYKDVNLWRDEDNRYISWFASRIYKDSSSDDDGSV